MLYIHCEKPDQSNMVEAAKGEVTKLSGDFGGRSNLHHCKWNKNIVQITIENKVSKSGLKHKLYLVQFWILCPIWSSSSCKENRSCLMGHPLMTSSKKADFSTPRISPDRPGPQPSRLKIVDIQASQFESYYPLHAFSGYFSAIFCYQLEWFWSSENPKNFLASHIFVALRERLIKAVNESNIKKQSFNHKIH